MRNERFQDRPGNARFATCPSTVLAGDLCLIGKLPGVAFESYDANKGGTTFRFSGTFALTVIAVTTVSPVVGSQVNQGDELFATGTLDTATNVTTGLTISKASGGQRIGTYDSPTPILSTVTSTAALVKLQESAS